MAYYSINVPIHEAAGALGAPMLLTMKRSDAPAPAPEPPGTKRVKVRVDFSRDCAPAIGYGMLTPKGAKWCATGGFRLLAHAMENPGSRRRVAGQLAQQRILTKKGYRWVLSPG